MNWNNIQFGANEVIKLCINVVLGAVFVVMMKADIRQLFEGLSDIKQESKEDRAQARAWQTKTEAEYGEMKVRIAILEQKVTNLEIQRDVKEK